MAPYSMELRVQASAAAAAFASLERRISERKALGIEINQRARTGVPPLQMEQEEFGRKITEFANSVGPILGDVQSFLAAVGAIESILWPSEAKQRHETEQARAARVERGSTVRALLRVPKDSPLQTQTRGQLDARGGLLHIDEMIDEFLRSKPNSYVSLEIGTFTGSALPRRPNTIRWLDEDTLELWVNGRHRNLREVRALLDGTVGRLQTYGTLRWDMSPEVPGEKPPVPRMALGTEL